MLLTGEKAAQANVRIFDLLGRAVGSVVLVPNEVSVFSFENEAGGVYILNVYVDNHFMSSEKIVIVKY